MLEKIKKNWKKRIERNAIKSVLTYANKKGIKLMKKKGLTMDELPNDAKETELVYFKRSSGFLGDWQRIYPPIDEEGRIKWLNLIFGGYRNLIKLILILGIIGMVLLQFKENFAAIEYWKGLAEVCNSSVSLNI